MKRFILAACLLPILSTIAFAAPKPDDKMEPDPGLDQKVTIRAVGKPLDVILKEVVEQTGVKMTARKDAADIKALVLVKDVPLSELNDALRDCLHLQCTREGKKGQWTYNFWEDEKARQEGERVKQELIKKLRERMDSAAEQLADLEKKGVDVATLVREYKALNRHEMSGWDSYPNREMFERYPALSSFSSQGMLPIVGLYANLGREQLGALWQGQEITVLFGSLSPDMQAKLANWCAPYTEETKTLLEQTNQGRELPDSVAGITLALREGDSRMSLNYMVHYARPSDVGADRKFADATGGSIDIAANELQKAPPDRMALGDYAARKDDSSKPCKLDPEKTMASPYDVLELVYDNGGPNIVSDYYVPLTFEEASNFRIQPGRRFATWDDALKLIAVKASCDLGKNGTIRTLSNTAWPVLRPREIPERLLAGWRKAKEQYGVLRIQEAMEIAKLDDQQLADFWKYSLGNASPVARYRSALKFVGALNSGQWKQATTDQGLSLRGLTADQLDLAQAWAMDWERLAPGDTSKYDDREVLRGYTLKIVQESNEGKDVYWGFMMAETPVTGAGSPNNPEAVGGIALDELNGKGFPVL